MSRIWNQDARTLAEKESFTRNAAKIWNLAPNDQKNIKTKYSAKKAINDCCKTLPL